MRRCVSIANEILMHLRNTKRLSAEVSLYEPIDCDSEGNALAIVDILKSEDTTLDEVDLKIKTEKLLKSIQTSLDMRERRIIKARYGLCATRPLTQREVAESFGISRSYVSRIEKKALEKLRAAMER